MANTRRITGKRKNADPESWSNFDPDLLFLIMIHLGLFDFFAFSGVCKSWRSLAVANWNKFMMSKLPMYLSLSDRMNKKKCYMEDYTRRKLKTRISHSSGRISVGLTCGYLIFFGRKTRDFWLVNPFTRKELHFPDFPFNVSIIPELIRGILVFSPSMSGWVFVILANRFSTGTGLAFSLAGKQAKWRQILCNSSICDLHFFKGKIYTLHAGDLLGELRLNSLPTFTLYKMKNFAWPKYIYQDFVSSGEKFYVMGICISTAKFDPIEVNIDEMEWMATERTTDEYAFF